MSKKGFPPLPEGSRYFSAGEVCELCDLEHHTLRYWTKIYEKTVSPERRKNRCYYSRTDVLILRQIKDLHDQGLTNAAILKKLQKKSGTEDKPALLESIVAGNKIRAQLQQVIRLLE